MRFFRFCCEGAQQNPRIFAGAQTQGVARKDFTLPDFWQKQRLCRLRRTDLTTFRGCQKIEALGAHGLRRQVRAKNFAFFTKIEKDFFDFFDFGKISILFSMLEIDFKVGLNSVPDPRKFYCVKFDSGRGETLSRSGIITGGKFSVLSRLNSVPDPRKFYVVKFDSGLVGPASEQHATRKLTVGGSYFRGINFFRKVSDLANSAIGPEKLLRNFSSLALRLELLGLSSKKASLLRSH